MPDGSSPLARGTPGDNVQSAHKCRFIPAGAGNTSRCWPRQRRPSVHPRWRGEHWPSAACEWMSVGSSPLARGTLDVCLIDTAPARFIPAGAGNTASWNLSSMSSTVHPRWRGEHRAGRDSDDTHYGSSPLARGTRRLQWPWRRLPRFIPAGAGNTRLPRRLGLQLPVHPRWRGEHKGRGQPIRIRRGSSPLARGTRGNGCRKFRHQRFIPAGAGNTPSQIPSGLPCPVHPRWRGEHA